MSQYTLNFEPALPERFPTLREFVAYRSATVDKPAKAQAADMDLAPSTLSRKLHPTDGDTQRFNLDDLEHWLASTGEARQVVAYLAAKFLDDDTGRQGRALLNVERMMSEMAAALAAMKGAK